MFEDSEALVPELLEGPEFYVIVRGILNYFNEIADFFVRVPIQDLIVFDKGYYIFVAEEFGQLLFSNLGQFGKFRGRL